MASPNRDPTSIRTHLLASLRAHRRGLVWMVEAIAFIAAGIGIFATIIAYNLQRAPLELRFLTPQLVAALDNRLTPTMVTIAKTSLLWVPGTYHLSIEVDDLKISDLHGTTIGIVPRATMSLSLPLLLVGQLVPLRILVDNPVFNYQPQSPALTPPVMTPPVSSGAAPELPVVIPDPKLLILNLVARLTRPGSVISALRRLEQVEIRHATVSIAGGDGAAPVTASPLDLTFDRNSNGFNLAGHGILNEGDNRADADLHVNYDRNARLLQYAVTIPWVTPSHWGAALPGKAKAIAALLDLPLRAELQGTFHRDSLTPGPVDFKFDASAGRVVSSRFDNGEYRLKSAGVSGSFDADGDRLDLAHIHLDLDGPTADAKIAVTHLLHSTLAAPSGFMLDLKIRDLPSERAAASWPAMILPKTRGWIVEHVEAGKLVALGVKGVWEVHPELAKPFVKKSIDGSMTLQGVRLEYLKGLAPAIGVDATGKFGLDDVDFSFNAGKVLGLQVLGGQTSISGLAQPDAPTQFVTRLDLAGPAADGITYIRADRLHLAGRLGITPKDVGGALSGKIEIKFPIDVEGAVPVDAIRYSGDVRLTNFTLAGKAMGDDLVGRDLTDGDLRLRFDPTQISAEGHASVGGLPMDLQWERPLTARDAAMHLHIATVANNADRLRFGIDPLPGAIDGPVGVDADLTLRPADVAGKIVLDFTAATLMLTDADWSKAPGTAGTMSFDGDMIAGHWRRMSDIRAKSQGLDVLGNIDFSPQGNIVAATAEKLVIGQTDALGKVAQIAGGWQIGLSGQAIDLGPYIEKLQESSTPEERENAPPMAVTLSADRILFGADRVLRDSRFYASFAHLTMQEADIRGKVGQGGNFYFHLDTPEHGGSIKFFSNDFGASLALLNISKHVSGGQGELDGQTVRLADGRHFSAHATAKDYRLTQAPIITKLLSLSSLSSVLSLLNGNGIPFKKFNADMSLYDGRLSLDNIIAYGDAFGMAAHGMVNFTTQKLGIDGTLAPAYLFNGILGDLPVVGGFLAGGQGSGLFAANFNVGGRFDAPSVSVNPFSILAPGILRKLFLFKAPEAGNADTPAEPKKGLP